MNLPGPLLFAGLAVFTMPLLGISGTEAVVAGVSVLLVKWCLYCTVAPGLALIGLVTTAVAFYGPGYVREFEHGRYS